MKVFKKIYEIVRQIPKGKVTTYGWVAVRLGNSGTVRVVGNALHQNPDPKNIPCHRIVDRTGRLAANYGFGGWREQKRKLLAEGVKFKGKTCVDLEKYLVKL
ncbi:MAG: O-6-methylguanine DNA methyltransferase [Microgenomates group bacterium LiPW_16]|nr:MAG: O-6-methylguanine DNA methyltransferase [Microgenomates group bacterium LiPW_16]